MPRTIESLDLRKLSRDLGLVLVDHLKRVPRPILANPEAVQKDFEDTIHDTLAGFVTESTPVVSDYVPVFDDEGKQRNCGCCGYPAPLKKFDADTDQGQQERFYCKVCSSTYLSKAVNYPRQTSDTALYKSLGWVVNHILSQTGK